jgi:hypothetical protein
MGVTHITDSRKLIFPLDLSKEHQPLSSSGPPWNSHSLFLLLSRLFSQMFLLHFLLAQKLLEGFCRDSSDSSIRALPISWPLNNSLLSFLEHVSLFSTHVSLRLVKRAFYVFPLASSIIIIMTFVHIHTPTFLLPINCRRKKAKS